MEVVCPKCGRVIDLRDINVGRDVAACLACGEVYRLSELVGTADATAMVAAPGRPAGPVDLDNAPSGCAFQRTPDGFEATGSTRSWIALFLLPVAVAWNGFLIFFIAMLVRMATQAGEAPTDAEGAEKSAEGASGTPLGVAIFLAVFMLPFIAGGLIQIGMVLMSLFGRLRVTVDRGRGEIYTGVFGLGRRKRFDWSGVRRVNEAGATAASPLPISVPGMSRIVLEGQQRVTFGKVLNPERSHFVAAALRQMLAEREPAERRRMF